MNQDALRKAFRRAVLGAAYVDNRSVARTISQPAHAGAGHRILLERGVESPRLDRKTRSLLNLAMLTALNRPHELKTDNVRGAINNGVTKEEIKEAFLQTAIYCGVPAAIDSFRNAREVLVEMGVL